MEQDQRAEAATTTAPTTATAPTDTAAGETAPAADRPETLAETLGTEGPGIAAEIEAELSGTDTGADTGTAAQDATPDPAPAGAGVDLGILSNVQVTLTARLCATSQPLGAVLSMKPGTIVDLGRETNGPIELLANGVVVAYGEVVSVGSSLGVRVTGLAK